jgi:hypothetical protein
VRSVLFPIDSFYWHMNRTRGYQLEYDTWLIQGVRYSNEMFSVLGRSSGEAYRIRRDHDVVHLERIPESVIEHVRVSQWK